MKQNAQVGSRRSLSIYSERMGEDVKRFDWRYRVKNRQHIPNFFPNNVENCEMETDPCLRFSTPEKLTYHQSIEDQHHSNIEITFLEDIIKDKTVAMHISEEVKEKLLSTHRLNKNQELSIDEDLLFGEDSDDSFNKDYTIPRLTMRKERIIKRDEARFEIEKKKRAEGFFERIAQNEALRLAEIEEADKLEKERAELNALKERQAKIDDKR